MFKEPEWDAEVPDKIKFKFVKQIANEIPESNPDCLPQSDGKFVRIHKTKSSEKNNSKIKLLKKGKKNMKKLQSQHTDTISNDKRSKKKLQNVFEAPQGKLTKLTPVAAAAKTTNLFKLRETLKGSRFRFLNEQLYTSKSINAKKMFEEDPEAFEAYHIGYRHQIEQWSLNPLNRIIKAINKLPTTNIIADFGCGDARLSKSVKHKVYSLDLVSQQENVIACDMANSPLETSSVHVVVFCLSLMGTNIQDFIFEANRVLKDGGLLEIAEVRSRFINENSFISSIEKCGFKILNKDLTNKLFYFMKFKKINNINKNCNSIGNLEFNLRPCLYKKR